MRHLDVHQHLWPEAYVAALRERRSSPRLDGWTLHLSGAPGDEVDARDHEVADLLARTGAAGCDVVLAHSSPLGVEDLPEAEGRPLLDAWHHGVAEVAVRSGGAVRWWGALPRSQATGTGAATGLEQLLQDGAAGLQIPATWVATPSAWSDLAEVLTTLASSGRPLLVHPGPAPGGAGTPGWWEPVVDFSAQMAAAWWAWQARASEMSEGLRVCFAAGAGLAPVHRERFAARGGPHLRIDPDVFVDLSGYGPQAFDALLRVLGVDALVAGSDHPYAAALDLPRDPAAAHAVRVANPHRLMNGGRP